MFSMVIQIFVNIELNCLRNSSDEVHADVTLVLGLVHHLQTNRCKELESDQAAHLAVDVSCGVDLTVNFL